MLAIYKSLVQELSAGRPAVLSGIIRQLGSSPRSLGTRFLICQDGSLVGSIGGGALEARVIDASRALMGSSRGLVLPVRMTGTEVAGTDMICGGNVDVLLQGFVPWETGARKVLEAILRLMEKGGRAVLATGPLPEPDRESGILELLYLDNGSVVGLEDMLPGVVDLIQAQATRILGTNTTHIFRVGETGPEVVLEPLYSRPTVLIFGGGHISVNLAPLAAMVGFRVVVVDDRAEFANKLRFPQADETLTADYDRCFDHLDFTDETYAVIVTRGHLHDKTVLANVLKRPYRYVGMIGSRRKRNMIYDALMEEGIGPDRIKTVHSPIGLDIGAETPEEIALSIVAELIQVRAEALRLVKDWKV